MEGLIVKEVEVALPASGGRILRGVSYSRAPDNRLCKDGDGGGDCDDGDGTLNWLLLHGWLDNAASFDLLVPHLFSPPAYLTNPPGSKAAAAASHSSSHRVANSRPYPPARSIARVVALDLAGHGRSDHRHGAYHAVDFAADAIAAADTLFGQGAR